VKPVIVTCAPTGRIHTPAIIHLHARDPETGQPDPRPEMG
jgi:uncharacterized protein (DUF849 family)